MVPIATDPLHPAEMDLHLYHKNDGTVSSLKGLEGLSLTLPRLPHPTELTFVLLGPGIGKLCHPHVHTTLSTI